METSDFEPSVRTFPVFQEGELNRVPFADRWGGEPTAATSASRLSSRGDVPASRG